MTNKSDKPNKTDTVRTPSKKKKKRKKGIDQRLLIGIIIGLVVIIIVLVVLLVTSRDSGSVEVQTTMHTERMTPAVTDDVTDDSESTDASLWSEEDGRMVYNDPAYKTITGIDVSEWNEDIDWESVRADGIDFVICRVGYRGYGTGKFVFDSNLESYLTDAGNAGLQTGLYFVSQSINEEEAIEEAEECLKYAENYSITMPIYIDLESANDTEARTADNTKEDWANIAKAFCDRIEEAGYTGGVYSNVSWIAENLELSELSDYDLWIANYVYYPAYSGGIDMWQYTESGNIDGILTSVDLNARIEKN